MKFVSIGAAAFAALASSAALFAQTPPPAQVNLDRVEAIVGNWTYRPFPGGSEADFFGATGRVRAIVRCNRAARRVTITRTGVAAAVPAMAVTTTTGTRILPARFESSRNLSVDIVAADNLLDQIAFSRGKFALSIAGSAALVLPAWDEPDRVFEDCRS